MASSESHPLPRRLEAALDAVCAAGAWLALPLTVLLFIQWPLRSLAGGQPQLANDLGQIVFAWYVALALRHTTRQGAHLSAARPAGQSAPGLKRWLPVLAQALCLLPWSVLLLGMGAPMIRSSVRQLEHFPDSSNPGYFLIKLALAALLLAMALQALIDLWRAWRVALGART